MRKDVNVNIRLSSDIVNKIDVLVAHGDYKSRTDFIEHGIDYLLSVPSKRQVVENNLEECTVRLSDIMSKFEYLVHETEKTRVPKSEALETGKNPAL